MNAEVHRVACLHPRSYRREGVSFVTSTPQISPQDSRLALAVRIGGSLHALPIDHIEEILPALPVETIPQCPAFVRGVVFVRGHLIPVLDAAERLGLHNHVRPAEPHIVCLRVNARLVGLEVDEALDLIDVPPVTLPIEELNARRAFLAGLIERDGQVIRLLDAEQLIAQDEAAALEPLPRRAARSPGNSSLKGDHW